MAFRELPTFYYHTHFCEFLEFVLGPCRSLLSQEHINFLTTFEQLHHLEQCTLVRLINRKYPIIKKASLRFEEIPSLSTHLDKLSEHGFVRQIHEGDIENALVLLTKAELQTIWEELTPINAPKILKSASKDVYLQACINLSCKALSKSEVFSHYLVRTTDKHINYFLYLYFGHTHGKLNQFSMRDLGIMRTREEQAQMQSRFQDFESAHSCFLLQNAYHEAKRLDFQSAHEIESYINTLPVAKSTQALSIRENVVFRLCKKLAEYNIEKVLTIAKSLELPAAQEYWCRQAYKLDQKEQVEKRLHKIIDDPTSDKLLQFAEDFLARKYHQKRTSVLTDMLRNNSRHLLIDETFKGSVEQGVIAYYKARGAQAWRTENFLWQNLFGLSFWHELFEIEGLGLATPFDYLPICLKYHHFLDVAENAIHKTLHSIQSAKDLLLLVTKNASTHFGKSQGIVHWHNQLIDQLRILIEHSPIDGLKGMLLQMCKNWQLYNDGYPDIMVLENNQLRFEEIKAQGDSLRRNQLIQIQSLENFGFDVGITTVDWVLDPMQAYAVVDIETTGGRAGTHKITEIGIVKMVNGEAVDQWQTLINPQRRIPAMITSLTGISNDMVIDAPLFADIADELEQFTEDCIFVAHNVNFDYGFIREEFARLGRTYKRPKLCTVQQMRKHYKGLASYSLANLTKHFNISMQRHHRALSDALAASELLKLVNEARAENSKPASLNTRSQ